ncbi:hypothetical protein P1X14_00395 [Sphingomonas sp. AOB5]|uniref:hypothetical protein n=1 Tax=Sphingomonas sp. AOB5 TaxID=3034017 RepID=UPI0023F693FB|nr:hypothetical protein [Sphingomonas sp. AOB5]MDF7773690.1 hypothetical protein [Sphingomonas sp. AOB5]
MSRLDIDLLLFGIALAVALVTFLLTRAPSAVRSARGSRVANLAALALVGLAGAWLVFEASHLVEA